MLREPQYYSIEERMALIKGFIDKGYSFYQIGNFFGGVSHQTIQYHWKRYHLKQFKNKQKLKVKTTDVYKDYLLELHKAGLI